jgi:glycosyltransferase involved in cell wall biosynthesis
MSNLVSVILPVYNAVNTVRDALQSILRQDYKNLEILVLDDGSTDGTIDILRELERLDSRIVVLSRENRGLSHSLNELILMARSDIIFRMDADDVSYIDRISNQVNFLNNNSDVVMVGGQIEFLHESSTCTGFYMPLDHDTIVSGLMQARFPICHPAIAFRRNIAVDCGLYSEVVAGEDLDFFLKMSERGLLANISQKVLQYRVSLSSLSVSKYDMLSQSYSFAIYNYKARKLGQVDVDWKTYDTIWRSRNFIQKFFNYAYGLSERFYRRYLMAKLNKDFNYLFYLLVASCLRPKTVLVRIAQLVRLKVLR